jgi:hypothetical protein
MHGVVPAPNTILNGVNKVKPATTLSIDSKVIHFYNQRGEDSENRIKELKNDFGARQMPLLSNSKSNSTCPVTELLCTTKSKTLPFI